ncbi:hypothetical protein PVT67_08915 [Gallaecimonas kandeliae]|uniref:hypothetical protein n=1 Tax=Gallaecimonas kandeliae TaxID=3029055 RepID=UPI002648A6F9|nr:hypothetical protein [Gallaecimonas kandeliae]WKE67334.1 hypothetical protein PVT67_08915 [Gallaecimonas kandeliae]
MPHRYLVAIENRNGEYNHQLHDVLVAWRAIKLQEGLWYLESGITKLAQPLLDELRKHLSTQDRLVVSECDDIAHLHTINPLPLRHQN